MIKPINIRRVNHGPVCTEPDCNEPYWAAGLCRVCYGRVRNQLPGTKARKSERQRKKYATDHTFRESVKAASAERYANKRRAMFVARLGMVD